MANNDYTNKYIEVKLTSTGRYTWSIRLPFDPTRDTISELTAIDAKLRTAFPKNTAEIKSMTRFHEVDID